MKVHKKLRVSVDNWLWERRFSRVYHQFRDFTMVCPTKYHANLRLANRIAEIDGCVVECGVWRGGMIAGIAEILGPSREYFLFDSFEGLPPAKEIDGKAALEWQSNTTSPTYYENCLAAPQFAEQAMRLSAAKSFQLRKGWFADTLPQFKPAKPVALLRLDADWYESTMICLETLFDLVTPGGLVLLDDYYDWDGCSRALHDFLSGRAATERIRNLDDVCYFLKEANPCGTCGDN